MIEDKEFGALFRDESEEHLQNLESGLMRLEADRDDDATLKAVFRSAHSLKGAARMLGIAGVEAIGHHFEDALGAAVSGRNRLTAQTVERLYEALDAVRSLVNEAVTGAPAGVDVPAVLERLGAAPSLSEDAKNEMEAETAALLAAPTATAPVLSSSVSVSPDAPTPSSNSEIQEAHAVPLPASTLQDSEAIVPFEPSTSETLAVSQESLAVPDPSLAVISASPVAVAVPVVVANWKIETIRVEPAKLDALLSTAGELVVTATRAHRGLAEIEAATTWLEEWSRATKLSRRTLSAASRGAGSQAAANGSPVSGSSVSGSSLDSSPWAQEMRRVIEREAQRLEQVGALLERLRVAFEDVDRLQSIAGEVEESIHNVRLLPLSTVFGLFARPVRDLARAQEKEVQLVVEGGETAADKRILEEIKDPLMHLLRNAIDHGVEAPAERERAAKNRLATLHLRGYGTATQIVIELRDDGRGLDVEAIRRSALRKGLLSAAELETLSAREVEDLIFAPGFSTAAQITDVSGRGVGLDVVRANVEKLRGTVEVESRAGQGCIFRLSMPATLATTRVLLVRCQNHTYALPIAAVRSVRQFVPNDTFSFRGREAIAHDGLPVAVARLSALLGVPEQSETRLSDVGSPCILLEEGGEPLALLVDALLDEQEIVLKPLDAPLRHSRLVGGTTILDSGEVCLMLNAQNLVKSALARFSSPAALEPARELGAASPQTPSRPKMILLAEDSITTRTQEKRILEGAGYQVVTAVDGLDAWHKLVAGEFDAVVSDIEMPNLTGLELAARIRQDEKHRELPIILVTSLASEADRRRGVEVGANAYITKGTFDQKALLDVLKKLA